MGRGQSRKSVYHTRAPEGGNMTQKQMILAHMKEAGSITPGVAMEEYGVFRLAARIADLKEDGVEIRTEIEKRKNRYGKTVRYARYRLA